MRLRFTALPSAFLMLHPNRLSSRPLARRKTANSRLVRRRPSRYTASYSDRRTRRAVRGKSCRGVSDARKTVAPLLAACRKYLPSTLALHSSAKSVLLMAAPHMRLKSAFRQRSSPLLFAQPLYLVRPARPASFASNSVISLQRIAHPNETMSLDDPRTSVKERRSHESSCEHFPPRQSNIRRKIANHPRRQPCCIHRGSCLCFCSFFPRLQQHRMPTTTLRPKNLASSLFQFPVSPKFSNSSTEVSPCFTLLLMLTPAAHFKVWPNRTNAAPWRIGESP